MRSPDRSDADNCRACAALNRRAEAAAEAARILEHFGAEVKVFDPMKLPMAGSVPEDHLRVLELRALSLCGRKAKSGAVLSVMELSRP